MKLPPPNPERLAEVEELRAKWASLMAEHAAVGHRRSAARGRLEEVRAAAYGLVPGAQVISHSGQVHLVVEARLAHHGNGYATLRPRGARGWRASVVLTLDKLARLCKPEELLTFEPDDIGPDHKQL
jgi:hypothetical protein